MFDDNNVEKLFASRNFLGEWKNMQVPLSIQESFEALSVISSFDMDEPNVKDGWQS